MSDKRAICDRELLRKSLDDALSDVQEEELSRHLSECADCQNELERLAAEQADWSKVGSALKREAASSPPTTHFPADAADEHDEVAADFAVDFLEPSPAPEAMGRLAEIDILEVIGRGGMGIVLKGFQPELKRMVAVKVLAPHLAASGAARQRFAREAQAAAAIQHPNVMPIFTVQSTGKLPFLVMPYVDCESLEERITHKGPLALADILRIGTQTARGLAAAHAQGLVHRDVKPANILLEKGVERVMLTDFGLARAVDDASLTRTGLIAGTPQFMSPEQAAGESIDARSDLFSLGSVLYMMATGRRPFRAETTLGILRRITDMQPRPIADVNSQIPAWFAAIVEKLHAKAPESRFASADEVAQLLEGCLAHVQQPTTLPLPAAATAGHSSKPSTLGRISSGRAILLAIAIAVGLAVIGPFAFLTRQGLREPQEKAAQQPRLTQPPAPPAVSPPAWQDDITTKILESERDIDQLEQETNLPWLRPQPTAAVRQSPKQTETKVQGTKK
jgi:serine/threonine protein kinase